MRSTQSRTWMATLLAAALLFSACSWGESESGSPIPAAGEEPTAVDQGGAQPLDQYRVTSLGEVKQAVIQIESQGRFVSPNFQKYDIAGRGSGFIIDPSGLAITNNHVVTGAASIDVWIGGDRNNLYKAQILAVSECSDLALIDIEGEGFSYLEWYSDSIDPGLEVYAAGFPLGNPQYTLTKGQITLTDAGGDSSWASISQVLEHNAVISLGSSGGPLVTQAGQIVGINYAAGPADNLYYAISREAALPVIKQFEEGDNVNSLGINGTAITSSGGELSGIWVNSLISGSPADQIGLEPGDLITTLEGVQVAGDGTMGTYCDILRAQGDEKALSTEVLRFQTNQRLEGQFNGHPLAVTGNLDGIDISSLRANTFSAGKFDNIVELLDDGYMGIRDDTGALYVEIPASWNQLDGSTWSDYWGEIAFEAEDITAAPDINDFRSYDDVPGISFTASRDWGEIGGYIMLLDGVKHWFEDDCTFQTRQKYQDQTYQGAIDSWMCGEGADLFLVGVRPIDQPTAFLVLITLQIDTDKKQILDRVLDTFQVNTDYLP